jgi:hypothetical protein
MSICSPEQSVEIAAEWMDDEVDRDAKQLERSEEDWMLCYQRWDCQRQCKRMKKADGAVGEYELSGVWKREKKRRVNKARSELPGLGHSVGRFPP